ncbi:MAG: hypothetical protein IIZ63_10060 [Caulobacteraceae bacterium]|nr:hypothetical protein [Caulobacteraceae bacterium]
MIYADARGRQLAALYRVYGVAATWRDTSAGVSNDVRVRRLAPDEVVDFGKGRAVLPTMTIKVRASEVPAPRKDDTVLIDGIAHVIVGKPTANVHRDEWSCPARPVG